MFPIDIMGFQIITLSMILNEVWLYCYNYGTVGVLVRHTRLSLPYIRRLWVRILSDSKIYNYKGWIWRPRKVRIFNKRQSDMPYQGATSLCKTSNLPFYLICPFYKFVFGRVIIITASTLVQPPINMILFPLAFCHKCQIAISAGRAFIRRQQFFGTSPTNGTWTFCLVRMCWRSALCITYNQFRLFDYCHVVQAFFDFRDGNRHCVVSNCC